MRATNGRRRSRVVAPPAHRQFLGNSTLTVGGSLAGGVGLKQRIDIKDDDGCILPQSQHRFHRKSDKQWVTPASRTRTKTVAIIIPAYNEAEGIAATIQSLLLQSLPADIQISALVVAANNCTDDTAAIARRFADRVSRY
jgi:hypothetical protein